MSGDYPVNCVALLRDREMYLEGIKGIGPRKCEGEEPEVFGKKFLLRQLYAH